MTVDPKAAKKAAKKAAAGVPATTGPAPGSDAHVLAPQKSTPPLDTSKWPLLLKNYSSLNVRTGHYTPIASGSTPLARPLAGELWSTRWAKGGGRGAGRAMEGGGERTGGQGEQPGRRLGEKSFFSGPPAPWRPRCRAQRAY